MTNKKRRKHGGTTFQEFLFLIATEPKEVFTAQKK
jgi:hypothetical protein